MSAADLWASFAHDPRRPEHAALRASDADRDLIHQVLTEAYADGRLDREEFDARSDQVTAARTLGELPAVVEDLVPTSSVPAVPPGKNLSSPQIEAAALAKWRSDRRSAFQGFLTASLICWVIWGFFTTAFPWPVIVTVVTGLNALSTAFQRDEIIAKERHRLEKKQRKALEQKPPPEEPPSKDTE